MLDHPATDDIQLEAVMHALGDSVRLEMVRTLAEQEAPCPCKAICVPVAKSTQSHHWRVLRDSGLIRQTERGRTRLTELRRDDLDARFPGLLTSVLHALSSARA